MKIWIPLSLARFKKVLEIAGFEIKDDIKKAEILLLPFSEIDQFKDEKKKIFEFIFSRQDLDYIVNNKELISLEWKQITFEGLDLPTIKLPMNKDTSSENPVIMLNDETIGIQHQNIFKIFILLPEFYRVFYSKTIVTLLKKICGIQEEFFEGFNEIISKPKTKSVLSRLIFLFSECSEHKSDDLEFIISDAPEILEILLKNDILSMDGKNILLSEKNKDKFEKILNFFDESGDK